MDGYGFKAAGKLHPVTRAWKEYLDEPVIVYNFEVEVWHTYYVSEAEVFDLADNYTLSDNTFTNPIGTNNKGKTLYTLKVVVDETGNVVTAYPKK